MRRFAFLLLAPAAAATALALAGASGARPAGSLPPPPTGLLQTWLGSFHLNDHVFRPGEKIVATAHVNAATCFVPNPPCVSGITWSGIGGKVISGCKQKVPHGTPTLECVWRAGEATDQWVVATANFSNPTGTSAISSDFYIVTSKRIVDGTVTYSKSGDAVPGVKLSIKGKHRYNATTNASGYYAVEVDKGSYTVVPEGGENNRFHPAKRHASLGFKATADFKLDEKPVAIEWSMPDRTVEWKSGTTIYMTDPGKINPSSWEVDFVLKTKKGTVCAQGTNYTWQVEGKPATFNPTDKPCHFTAQFPKQGKYLVTVTVKQPDGEELDGKVTIDVRDFLVVGLGDSVGSGEGNPEFPGSLASDAHWEDDNCHRSHFSFEAIAALKLEQADPHTSVTFVHLACSGAAIQFGIVGRYIGFSSVPLDPQLTQMKNLIGSRRPDAVLVSIGANDIGFGNIVAFCTNILGGGDRTVPPTPFTVGATADDIDDDCMNKAPPEPAANAPTVLNPTNPFDQRGITMGQITLARLARLNCTSPPAYTIMGQPACSGGGLYVQLSQGFTDAHVAGDRVFITEYFDPTHDDQGNVCGAIAVNQPIWVTGGGFIGPREATWAAATVVQHGLNTEVPAAATKYGWKFVGGIASAYRTHGYCAGAAARWVVTVLQAATTGDSAGALHPNPSGHQFAGEQVYDKLKGKLYKDGKPVAPAG